MGDSTAEWNGADQRIFEISRLLRLANDSRLGDDFDNWYDSLEALESELSPWMSEGEATEAEKYILESRKWIKFSNPLVNRGLDPFYIRDKLRSLEKVLRKIIHDNGLDIPKKVDPGSALRDSRGY